MNNNTYLLSCSIVISVFNEQEGIRDFYEELVRNTSDNDVLYDYIFVNDGSTDNSLSLLSDIASNDKRVKVINFSRNFGHEAAMIAGIDYSKSDVVICMDSDIQHPPAMIGKMLEKYKEGFDVVNMVRTEREDAGVMKRITSKLFYRFVNKISSIKISENASDFFLISRKVAECLRMNFRERTRFLRGMIQLVGFNKTTLEYVAQKRMAGNSKYSFLKLFRLSFSAISSLSKLPLQLGLVFGTIFIFISVVLFMYSLVMWMLQTPLSGYTTLVMFMSAFAGIQLFVLGIIGQYIGYIFDEIKGRPIYIISNIIKNEEDEEK